jgi:phosphoesterase RecJ-like protein
MNQMAHRAERILVTAHSDPDGDSIGAQLALADYLRSRKKKVRVFNQGRMPTKYRFLDPQRRLGEFHPTLKFNPDLAFVIECPSLERIGKVRHLLGPACPIINIDHHPENERFGQINWLDTRAAAVGEMIYEFLVAARHPISPAVATLLYTAILTDTGRFRYGSTRPQTLSICAALMAQGADPKVITDEVYFNHPPANLRLIGQVVRNLELAYGKRICALSIRRADLERFGAHFEDTEGIVDYSLFAKGVAVGLLFKEVTPRKTKVSLRSQNHIDISRVARKFGGGGHANAAGCSVAAPLETAKKQVLKEVIWYLRNGAGRNALNR